MKPKTQSINFLNNLAPINQPNSPNQTLTKKNYRFENCLPFKNQTRNRTQVHAKPTMFTHTGAQEHQNQQRHCDRRKKEIKDKQNFTVSRNVREHEHSDNKSEEEENKNCRHRQLRAPFGSRRSPGPLLLVSSATANPDSNVIAGAVAVVQIVGPHSHPKPLHSRLPLLSHTITMMNTHCFSFSLYPTPLTHVLVFL